jgi:hypothetical protein
LLAVAVCIALAATGILTPIAAWLAVRWSLLAPVVELERRSGLDGLRRSAELVGGVRLRVGSLVGISALLALAAGPFLGALSSSSRMRHWRCSTSSPVSCTRSRSPSSRS